MGACYGIFHTEYKLLIEYTESNHSVAAWYIDVLYETKVFTEMLDVWRIKIEKIEYFYTSINIKGVLIKVHERKK